jgi:SAM-dependent methyltransferase
MLLDSVRRLLGRHQPPASVPHPAAEPAPPASVAAPEIADCEDPVWPSSRIGVVETLWGEGFLFAGGRAEALRLAKPLGLSEASSLLLIGAGTGGAPRCIAEEFGVWVTGYEANARLVILANERSQRAGLGRRAQVEPWDPAAPQFPRQYFHHAMVLEALRGTAPEPLLEAVARAVKPGGQLVLLETVADRPLDPADPTVATWLRIDHRPVNVPSELAMMEVLRRLRFDVRIAEDVSRREMREAIDGWRLAVQAMAETRPAPRKVAAVLREAELWLARFRLMRAGKLRLVRWHALAPGA